MEPAGGGNSGVSDDSRDSDDVQHRERSRAGIYGVRAVADFTRGVWKNALAGLRAGGVVHCAIYLFGKGGVGHRSLWSRLGYRGSGWATGTRKLETRPGTQ